MNIADKIKNMWLGLRTGWSIMRLLRFILSIAMFVEVFRTHDWIYILPGIFLLWQAVFNTGCCTVYRTTGKTKEDKDVIFEEIK